MEIKSFTITKRDGSKDSFSLDKIMHAIVKAFESVNEPSDLVSISKIISRLNIKDDITVEDIQNQVEEALMSEGFFKVAKSFILYRQEHSEDRETLADGETVGVHPIHDFQEGTLLVRGGQGFISVTTRGAGSLVSVYSTDGRCLRHLYIQQERFKNFKGIHSNAQMTEKKIHQYAEPDAASVNMLRQAMEMLMLSARAYTRILKVSRTIADLAGSEKVETMHIAEAIGYRNLDRGD